MNYTVTINTEVGVKFDAVVYLDAVEYKCLVSFNTMDLDWMDFNKNSIVRKYKISSIQVKPLYSDVIFWCNDEIVKEIINNINSRVKK